VVTVSLLYAGYQVRTEKRNLRQRPRAAGPRPGRESAGERRAIARPGIREETCSDSSSASASREHLKGIAVYDDSGAAVAITPGLAGRFHEAQRAATRAGALRLRSQQIYRSGGRADAHLPRCRFTATGDRRTLAVFYDASL